MRAQMGRLTEAFAGHGVVGVSCEEKVNGSIVLGAVSNGARCGLTG